MALEDDIVNYSLRRIEEAVQTHLDELRDNIKEAISIPVETVIGPRGGIIKIRSKPGEPPRKDTGRLHSSITNGVIVAGDTISGSVSTETPYATPLEHQLNRPIMRAKLEARFDAIEQDIQNALNS